MTERMVFDKAVKEKKVLRVNRKQITKLREFCLKEIAVKSKLQDIFDENGQGDLIRSLHLTSTKEAVLSLNRIVKILDFLATKTIDK